MEPSIFTRIIRGELPCHKIYEDNKTLAFLDIHPAQPGQTIVVPKIQVDRLEDLEQSDYDALMTTVKKIMRTIVKVLGTEYRACLKVEGFEVPHVHVVIIPCQTAQDFRALPNEDEPDHKALAEIAAKLSLL